MTLLDRILARGVTMPPDPIIAARVERHLRRIQPDPLFRRRLRGQVLNRYVATREGLVPQMALGRRREMGVLGRGVLYASLLTAMSVGAVAAAAQESQPGDALYSVKLTLEDIRMQVAPPGLRDDLAAMAVEERLEEVEQLAATGDWQLVDEAAARVARAEERLTALTGGDPAHAAPGQASADSIGRHAARLAALLATAPASARDGLRQAIDASTKEHPATVQPPNVQPTHDHPRPSETEEPATPVEQPADPTGHPTRSSR